MAPKLPDVAKASAPGQLKHYNLKSSSQSLFTKPLVGRLRARLSPGMSDGGSNSRYALVFNCVAK